MSQYPGGQYPGGQPPYDPYYGRPPDPYAPPPQQPPQPSDPYFGQPPTSDPYYGQPQDPYAQQAAYQAWQQQQAWLQSQQPPPPPRTRGGAGPAVAGIFLVLLGAWVLFRDQISIDIGQTWPVLAVGLGIIMVIAAFIPRRG